MFCPSVLPKLVHGITTAIPRLELSRGPKDFKFMRQQDLLPPWHLPWHEWEFSNFIMQFLWVRKPHSCFKWIDPWVAPIHAFCLSLSPNYQHSNSPFVSTLFPSLQLCNLLLTENHAFHSSPSCYSSELDVISIILPRNPFSATQFYLYTLYVSSGMSPEPCAAPRAFPLWVVSVPIAPFPVRFPF
jgi:hypothetical protein